MDKYIEYCMGASDSIKEWKNVKQRYAVCRSIYEQHKKKAKATKLAPLKNESDSQWMARCLEDEGMIDGEPDQAKRQKKCEAMFKDKPVIEGANPFAGIEFYVID
jgi:hypothetical protein